MVSQTPLLGEKSKFLFVVYWKPCLKDILFEILFLYTYWEYSWFTSVGNHPVEVVQTISKIIGKVENSSLIALKHKHPRDYDSDRFITKSICYYAAKVANDTNARAISTLTNSGYTAYQISSWRPKTHVLVFTSNKKILTQLNLLWGVKAFYYDSTESTDRTVEEINNIAVENNYLQKDDKVINLTSMPINKKGMVNTLRISKI